MDPTAADVRAGNAVYDDTTGTYQWLPGKDPNAAVWDSGTGDAVVTVSAAAQPADHSLVWLVLGLAATWWVLEEG